MTTITHQELVANLAKPGRALINDLTPETAHLLHMAVGICGEAAELYVGATAWVGGRHPDLENLTEELGDIGFYMEGLIQALESRVSAPIRAELYKVLEHPLPTNAHSTAEAIAIPMAIAGDLLDVVKKSALYAKPVDSVAIIERLQGVAISLGYFLVRGNLRWADCLAANVVKLQKRYHGGTFQNQHAQERADKA